MPLALDDVAPQKVLAFLSAADVVVLTSEREGSPVVTKEALCAGTRVVSVRVGDMEWQLEGMSGCDIVDVPKPPVIAAAVLEALAAPPPDAETARARFDIARTAEGVSRVYDSVTGAEPRD